MDSLEFFGTFGLSYVIALQRQLAAHDFDEVLRKQSCEKGRTKNLLIGSEPPPHPLNVTFRQNVAQTQSGHDVIHVTVDALGHSRILKHKV